MAALKKHGSSCISLNYYCCLHKRFSTGGPQILVTVLFMYCKTTGEITFAPFDGVTSRVVKRGVTEFGGRSLHPSETRAQIRVT
jgi:hypothetical protein